MTTPFARCAELVPMLRAGMSPVPFRDALNNRAANLQSTFPRLSSRRGSQLQQGKTWSRNPAENKARTFPPARTTDWRHVLTTIGLKCDDGIIGTRGFIVVNNCLASV